VLLSNKPIGEGSSFPSSPSAKGGVMLVSKKSLEPSSSFSDLDGELNSGGNDRGSSCA
jgi:hypothetical protein